MAELTKEYFKEYFDDQLKKLVTKEYFEERIQGLVTKEYFHAEVKKIYTRLDDTLTKGDFYSEFKPLKNDVAAIRERLEIVDKRDVEGSDTFARDILRIPRKMKRVRKSE